MRLAARRRLMMSMGVAFFVGACGKSSTAPEVGSFEATVSGDLSVTLSGTAIFGVGDYGPGDQWMVYMPRTTAAAFEVISVGPAESAMRLPAGTHEIVEATTAANGEVVGVYLSFSGQADVFGSTSGTLTITESSADVVRGNFTFTAAELTSGLTTIDPDGRQVTVSGEFVAIPGSVPSLSTRR
jgi:hypothetical protein